MPTSITPHTILLTLATLLLSAPALAADPTPATLPADYQGKPYNKQPLPIPGTIKAAEYDIAPNAANGITFNYNTPPKSSTLRTTKDAIGLASFGKGHVTTQGEPEKPEQTYLGWTHAAEWTKYTLHVKEAGTYQISAHVAAGAKGGKISLSFTPAPLTTGPLDIPTTAGYQPGVEVYHVWETLPNLAQITLPAGDTILTLKIEAPGGLNIESLTLTKKP